MSGTLSPKDGASSAADVEVQESLRYERKNRWENEKGEVIWPAHRIHFYKFVSSQLFESAMGFVITLNMVLIIIETNSEARCYPAFDNNLDACPDRASGIVWLRFMNLALLIIYTIEALARMYCERSEYFRSSWNSLDFIIVFASWVSEIFGNVVNITFLRFFRLIRLMRVARILLSFRELYLLLTGLVSVARTIMWGSFMMLALLTLWSIILVEFVHPHNSKITYDGCDRCSMGFKSVWDSNLTLFQQIVAGDSWGLISVPLIEHHPWVAVILIAVFLMLSLGLTNLILAVIVQRAQEAQDRDIQSKLKQREEDEEAQRKRFITLCSSMDEDDSGTITGGELIGAFDTNEEFRNTLKLMDIEKDELAGLFKALDKDGSGEVSYIEFASELGNIKTRDTGTMLTFIKLDIQEIKASMSRIAGAIGIDPNSTAPVPVSPNGHRRHTNGTQWTPTPSEDKDRSESPNRQQAKLDELVGEHAKIVANKAEIEKQERLALQSEILQSMKSIDSKIAGLVERETKSVPQRSRSLVPLSRPSTEDGLMKMLEGLGQHVERLAETKGGIAHSLSDQVNTLSQQANILAALSASKEEQAAKMEKAVFTRVEEKLQRLQENMRRELPELLQDIERRLEDGSATLARNTQLLTCLSEDLKCSADVAELASRSSWARTRAPETGSILADFCGGRAPIASAALVSNGRGGREAASRTRNVICTS